MIVFVGPTLPAGDAAGFELRPPAAHGDLYLAAQARPAAIGLVDGYFDERPAVWHKEILWALSEGIPVYGAASMGALRAAELCAFGMRGIGRIFEDYRDGRLTADDAVALAHGPAGTGYVALSEPLVNIEATLEQAVRSGVVTSSGAEELRARARALHYRERRWETILEGTAHGALAAWLPSNKVDQKRLDALAMLAAMQRAAAPEAVSFRFQRTDLWRDVVDRLGAQATVDAGEREALLDEIRLASGIDDLYWRAMARRMLRRPKSTANVSARATSELRQRLGLYRKEALDRWLSANDVDEANFGRLAAEEATLAAARDKHWLDGLIDELRLAGGLVPILERVRHKRALLAAHGQEDGVSGGHATHPGDSLAGLVAWFCRRRDLPTPDDLDGFCAMLGFESRTALHRALARERSYCMLQPDDEGPKIAAAVEW